MRRKGKSWFDVCSLVLRPTYTEDVQETASFGCIWNLSYAVQVFGTLPPIFPMCYDIVMSQLLAARTISLHAQPRVLVLACFSYGSEVHGSRIHCMMLRQQWESE
ncbi:hypothetical protein GUJ93_ZPchr0008g12382 [Zizania palustris]|uniref:Uncharacterized protein n=1 Tax=Zizania palustris TaxID=103762 RepID=A0A8J5R7N9_ZIZPA|nr:hypothetical protein GUJ93_ZPchr0008g12382 [Zizania palustris]